MATYAEAMVRQYNQRLAQQGRVDIEWALDGNGHPYIRDRFDWSARRTRELDMKAEQSRQAWRRVQPRTINEEM